MILNSRTSLLVLHAGAWAFSLPTGSHLFVLISL